MKQFWPNKLKLALTLELSACALTPEHHGLHSLAIGLRVVDTWRLDHWGFMVECNE